MWWLLLVLIKNKVEISERNKFFLSPRVGVAPVVMKLEFSMEVSSQFSAPENKVKYICYLPNKLIFQKPVEYLIAPGIKNNLASE